MVVADVDLLRYWIAVGNMELSMVIPGDTLLGNTSRNIHGLPLFFNHPRVN